ncbi:nuclear transport factor 2 family protein [Hyphococcus sp.]|uniref:nuclear transport factor 2 family protein n=1 Tax=Hyphococcus sp. TaxID=2038636 RepID=UPI003D0A502F
MQVHKIKRDVLRLALTGLIGAAGLGFAACSHDVPAIEAQAAWGEEGFAQAARLIADADNIQSVRDVKRLQHIFAHYAEAGDWKAMSRLFSEEGKYVASGVEVSGKDALYAHFREEMGEGADGLAPDRLNVRLILSPVVTLSGDGKSAKGRWHEVAMLGRYGEEAFWQGGIYENDYVLEDGVWKIATLHYYPQYAGPYGKGWRNVADHVPLTPYHYTPDEAGVPTPALTEARLLSAKKAPARLARANAIADALLDESAVQNLQAAYGYYVDRKMWDDVADLFAEDATFDVAGEGVYQGRSAIRRRFYGLSEPGLKEGELNDHLQLDPVVTLTSENKASARGFELQMTGQHGGASAWAFGIFENSYVKDNGVWKIQSVKLYPRFAADYDIGWTKSLLPAHEKAGDGAKSSSLKSAEYPEHASPKISFPVSVRRRAGSSSPKPGLDDLERKLAVAKAYDGAENVSDAYGYYIDEFRWDDTADLFSEDGWKELSYIGAYYGRERVRGSLFSRYGDRGRSPTFMAIHQKTQPFVTVAPDGKSAQIRLRLFQFNSQSNGDGSYISGIYENQVKLEDGVWKIAGMDLDYVFLANYTGGWAAVQQGSAQRFAPTPESVAKYPPDGPLRGVIFAPYPEIAPMGFHFNNPVSGRPPALKLDWSISSRYSEGG